MMRLLYPLVASALITIAPFLLTFEKGQDIVRGLFGFEEFALLLCFAWVKPQNASAKLGVTRLRYAAMALIVALMLVVAYLDLSNLLAIKGWNMGWYGIVPVVTCGLAVAMMWKVPPFTFPTVNLIVFVALIAHLFAYNNYAAQPLAQFPVVDYLARTAPKPVERKVLPEEFTAKYSVEDSAFVARRYVDSTRSNVFVLVESWGIPLDNERFEAELSVFRDAGVPVQVGVHSRMYSRTRTAERENLIYELKRDSATRRRDTLFIPAQLAAAGFDTRFYVALDSAEQWRYKYIRNVGFGNVVWDKSLSDGEIAKMLDSILTVPSDSGAAAPKVFAAWTTTATKFPVEGLTAPGSDVTQAAYRIPVEKLDSAYTVRLMETLRLVADLARKHPDVRFVVEGDHEPILSPLKFQERFYKRWTPYVILN